MNLSQNYLRVRQHDYSILTYCGAAASVQLDHSVWYYCCWTIYTPIHNLHNNKINVTSLIPKLVRCWYGNKP